MTVIILPDWMERYNLDARAMTVLEGASEIQRHIIAGEL